MNEKMLVEISLPAAGAKYDFFIPARRQIGAIAQVVAALFAQRCAGYYCVSQPVLCRADSGESLDVNKCPCELEIQNGTKLFLV